jgi:DNA topoisomerase-1
MRDTHVEVRRSTLRFEFRGKSGKRHAVDVNDPHLARIVRQCRDLPGQELFQYLDDDGRRRAINSADVNAYLKDITGEAFTAKDFRTWAATKLAALALQEVEPPSSLAQAKKNVLLAIDAVAHVLGNTRSVCRKSYIHPAILDRYMNRSMRVKSAVRSASRRSHRRARGSRRPARRTSRAAS